MPKKHLISMNQEGPRLHPSTDEKMVPKISVLNEEPWDLNLLVESVDVSVVNAIRRILIAEVPTMAIETVKMFLNTGLMQDEVLCHRLGLIPLAIDPEEFEYRRENEELTAANSVCYKLHIKGAAKKLQGNTLVPVYAKDLALQESDSGVEPNSNWLPTHPDILLTKLAPAQEIELVAYAEKGTGKTHAKWNPVCTAFYRFMPEFELDQIEGEDAEELKIICVAEVFDIEEIGRKKKAIAKDPKACTSCRACIERFPNMKMSKNRNRILFNVESSGVIESRVLFCRAISILKQKGESLIKLANELQVPSDQETGIAFTLKNEDHTLGNVLNFYLNLNPSVEFASYNQSHPSQPDIILRIQSPDPLRALVGAADDIMEVCDELMACMG